MSNCTLLIVKACHFDWSVSVMEKSTDENAEKLFIGESPSPRWNTASASEAFTA